jgi:hypothetical protein
MAIVTAKPSKETIRPLIKLFHFWVIVFCRLGLEKRACLDPDQFFIPVKRYECALIGICHIELPREVLDWHGEMTNDKMPTKH